MQIYLSMPSRDGRPLALARDRAMRAAKQADNVALFDLTVGCHSVATTRNTAVRRFLDSDCTHILFIDDDVIISVDGIALLSSVSAPVVAGCVPIKSPKNPVHLNIADHWDENGKALWMPTWFDGPREVCLAGTGVILIERGVIEALGFPWFRWPGDFEESPEFGSDDTDFCMRVTRAGLGPIMAHGNVRCGHHKELDLAGFIVDARCPHCTGQLWGLEDRVQTYEKYYEAEIA